MKPQENKQLALRKAISAHEEAEASLADLMENRSDANYAAMQERVEENLRELQAEAESSDPSDTL